MADGYKERYNRYMQAKAEGKLSKEELRVLWAEVEETYGQQSEGGSAEKPRELSPHELTFAEKEIARNRQRRNDVDNAHYAWSNLRSDGTRTGSNEHIRLTDPPRLPDSLRKPQSDQ
jgi:hypothetical protein